ncbi:hypothetical protein ACFX14_006175 [Malus domestica]
MEIGNPSRFGSRQLPSTLPTPSTVSVKFYNGVSSSLSLLRATPRVRTLRCSALSSALLGKFSNFLLEQLIKLHFLSGMCLVSEKLWNFGWIIEY